MPPSAEEQIRALVIAYAERLDAGDLDGVAELFTHGRFCSARGGRPRTGADAVRKMYDSVRIYDDGTPRTKHVLGNILVDVDDAAGAATARCTFVVFQHSEGTPLRAVLAGRYEDVLARVDSIWRITERVVHPDLQGDLSRHMAR